MSRFLIRRVLISLLLVLLVETIVFSLVHLLPGDPVMIILGSERTPDPKVVEAVRVKLGLDQPLPVQYVRWLGGLIQRDLGLSLVDGSPVWDTIAERLPRTLELVTVAMILATLIGIPLGIFAALRWNRPTDRVLSILGALGISSPVYVVGTLLVLLFGVTWRWLPIAGYAPITDSWTEHLRRLTLPAITLALGPMAIITRMTRSSMLEVFQQDYVRTARAKGLHERVVVTRHMLSNALIPIVTVIGLQMGTLIGGSVLVEYIFNWPGLSTLLVTALGRRDYPIVQGVILTSASLFIIFNMIVDMLYGVLDPRVRYS
ncbi:MAG: ABC transporter permease [Chloroflexi bacterium]|nr:ABC transporter permease [Chloroflexota bacterium]